MIKTPLMKNHLLALLMLITCTCLAGRVDSTFQRQQFSFSVTNAASHEFYKDPNTTSLTAPYPYNVTPSLYGPGSISGGYGSYPSYGSVPAYQFGTSIPLYALHLSVKYSLGISSHIRLETGIAYLLQGFTYQFRITSAQEQQLLADSAAPFPSFNHYLFTGSITVPVHIKFLKPLKKKGAFTCTLGLNFLMPVHSFEKFSFFETDGLAAYSTSYHHMYSRAATSAYASGGIDMKMGYEKKLSNSLAMDIGPIVSFNNLFYFSKQLNNAYSLYQARPYQYYIGVDIAFNLGLKK
jgi:hypothetical protein